MTNDISTQVILKLLEIGGQKLISISTEVIMKLIDIGGHELVMQEVHDGISPLHAACYNRVSSELIMMFSSLM